MTIVRSNYCNMRQELKNLGIEKVDGIVLDLGVSSFQLDTPKRGFTYMEENAPLDMRMDQRESRTARDIVNTYSEKELYRIIRDFGEDKFAKNIAKHIVAAREKQPIETTGELTAIIRSAIPKKVQMSGGHPAKRTFQAIRIELNRELEVLQDTLDDMIELLNEDGRICIITFHSLEDRIVKTIFKKNENPCTCPSDFPVCVCGKESKGKVITRKPILPGEEELRENSRSKSAKLRVFEREVKDKKAEVSKMEQNQYRMYVDGNTVRKAEALPKDDRQERIRREREEQRARNRKIAKRNQARELRMSRRYVAFLAVAVSITCLVCAAYVHLQADITTRMSNISALEKEIADLKTDNDTTLKRVNTSINLNEIKEKAIAELGMVYAAPDQVAYYSIEDSDYMTQYEEIPGK